MPLHSSLWRKNSSLHRIFGSSTTTTLVATTLASAVSCTLAWTVATRSAHTKNMSTASFRNHVQPRLENSWIEQLNAETPDNLAKSRRRSGLGDDDDNTTKRPVLNGHYVKVKPTGLSEPRLVLWSKDVALNLLGLTPDHVESNDFLQYVSGNLVLNDTSWATPYALSIMGTRYVNNCPYQTGDGYGDGRAISIGEFSGHELQLKGAGPTPFCRGADGRAVLRSSIREFLASEAMHALGIATTRALSLVVSDRDVVARPWYREAEVGTAAARLPQMDDPRLAAYPPEKRREILRQSRRQYKSDPDVMQQEPAAITCRVATSFTRIGHVDLFARRMERATKIAQQAGSKSLYYTESEEWKELEKIIWHACFREYRDTAYTPYKESGDLAAAATVLLNESAERLATSK